jgi:hypothetical protein
MMTRNKKAIRLLGIACVIINAVSIYFFINRNRFGDFVSQVSYEKLYSPTYNTPEQTKKWQITSDQYGVKQLEEARKLSVANAGINPADSTFTKVKKIGSWLRRSFSGCTIGKPADFFERLSSIEQYKSAARAESPIWCGTYGSQFSFFCSANGITSRYIESKGGHDNHVVNEAFIPELNQWVFSDLLNNIVYCQDSSNRILNTADLVYRNVNKDTFSFIAYGQTAETMMSLQPRKEQSQLWHTYFNAGNKLFYYYTTDLRHVYSPSQKIMRYFYPKGWYELFTLTTVSNTAFYIRSFFLYFGLVVFLIFIPFYLNRK